MWRKVYREALEHRSENAGMVAKTGEDPVTVR